MHISRNLTLSTCLLTLATLPACFSNSTGSLLEEDNGSETGEDPSTDDEGDPTTDDAGDGDGDDGSEEGEDTGPGCAMGGLDCECTDGGGCDPGLSCVEGWCEATCGDGQVVAEVEACDDGNLQDADGCDSDCSLSGIDEMALGQSHVCVLTDTQSVRCWGSSYWGQLGGASTEFIGDDEPVAAATRVELGAHVEAIAAGSSHTCAILESGDVRCWGRGDKGQLGAPAGEAGPNGLPCVGDDEAPTTMSALHFEAPALAISAGSSHTCALLETGAVHCWGANGFGQLGLSDVDPGASVGDDELAVDMAPVDLGEAALAIDTGPRHTCAILESGGVRCWGANDSGQLGAGELGWGVPAGLVGLPHTVVEVAAGFGHTCALLADDTVRCWGANSHGQLGLGLDAEELAMLETPLPETPVELGAQGSVVAVRASVDQTCAEFDTGSVRCWGGNARGQLGMSHTNDIGDDELPNTVNDIPFSNPVVSLATSHQPLNVNFPAYSCAVTSASEIYCWGGNIGQLGYAFDEDVGDDEFPAEVGPVALFEL